MARRYRNRQPLTTPLAPRPCDSYVRRADVLDITDGDTLHLASDLGFDDYRRVAVRLVGINTPEMKGATAAAGKKAQQNLIDMIMADGMSPILPQLGTGFRSIMVKTFLTSKLLPPKYQKDKYGRFIAEAWLGLPEAGYTANSRQLTDGFALVAEYMKVKPVFREILLQSPGHWPLALTDPKEAKRLKAPPIHFTLGTLLAAQRRKKT